MFCKPALLLLTAASAVLAAPTPAALTDTDVLQFALALENLENAFYSQVLSQYDAQDFADAGLPDWVRGRLAQIGEHEAAHVKFLQGALGSAAGKPCEYNFPYDSPASAVDMSLALESVGDAAYLGAAQLVSDKGVLTDAASVLSVEARHSAWLSSAVQKNQPWNGPFDAPLTPSGAFSLASLFIKSCPAANPALPVKTFPALTISPASPTQGQTVSFKFTLPQGQAAPANTYVAWLNGLDVVFTVLDKEGQTTVPQGLAGTVFATVVSSEVAPSDENMVAGYTILQMPFDSHVQSA
ncbi:hypothetical protein PYCCODRAFT_1427221 [Trametes coccinea BRFM310]|uniref:Ferritin-like domain-containing protein n=1 Tax=Trametes coccinea (strain BRFM310) TaxID=1353009 RepID=A0A1Y2IHK3_TRAC3|nr:hypothetical protein PYCCODRAFT_1427221 [Trametes coccinea BRFM310]